MIIGNILINLVEVNFVETGEDSILNNKIEIANPSENFEPIEIAEQSEIYTLIQNELIQCLFI